MRVYEFQKIHYETYSETMRELEELAKKHSFTHVQSSKTLYALLTYMLTEDYYLEENAKLFIGKPFGFYSYFYLLKKLAILTQNEFNVVIEILKKYNFDSVIDLDKIKKLKNELRKKFTKQELFIFNKVAMNFEYIDTTLGSSLSVALGYLESNKDEIKSKNIKIKVILPDSVLMMGEFYEDLMLINDINKRDSEILKHLKIYIDYNGSTKQNEISIDENKIIKMLSVLEPDGHNVFYLINTKIFKKD